MAIARNTVAKGLSDDEFAVYLYNCQRQNIHPLDGLLVPISRNDSESNSKRLTFVSTVDLLRSRAADTGDYAGNEDPVFEHLDGAKNPQSAAAIVTKFVHGEKCHFTATARWDEYYPGDGKAGFMWRAKPHVMLGKCAEALALRKAFPKQLAGLYVAEELEKDAPRRSVRAQAAVDTPPIPSVKCSECNAEGGHLPKCSKRQQPEAAKTEAKPAPKDEQHQAAPKAEKTICSECRQADGHAKDCKYFVAPAEKPKTLCLITAVVQKQKKDTKEPYFVLSIVTKGKDGDMEGKLYVWHKTLHEYLAGKKNVLLVGEVSERKTKDEKMFYSLEHIFELGGVKFENDKPVAAVTADEEVEAELFGEPV
jgi:phage recombination protein Bet